MFSLISSVTVGTHSQKLTGANDWGEKQRPRKPGCIEELTAAARAWMHLVSEIETLAKRYGAAILEPRTIDASCVRDRDASKKVRYDNTGPPHTRALNCRLLPIQYTSCAIVGTTGTLRWQSIGSHLEMVGNSNRDSEFSSEKFTDSLHFLDCSLFNPAHAPFFFGPRRR